MTVNRRTLLGASAAAGAAAAVAAASPAEAKRTKRYSFTVMGTTDLHGNVFNWDYFADKEYADAAGNTRGIARIATLVKQVREAKGRKNTLLIDSGDTIQGTPLAYYYARVDPIVAEAGPVHPMAQSMNEIGYDAAALGNHEFNYGLDTLRKFESQLEFPLLGANTIDVETGKPPSRRTTWSACAPTAARTSRSPSSASAPRREHLGQGLCGRRPGVPEPGVRGRPLGAEAQGDGRRRRRHLGPLGTSGSLAYDTSTGLGVEDAFVLVAEQFSDRRDPRGPRPRRDRGAARRRPRRPRGRPIRPALLRPAPQPLDFELVFKRPWTVDREGLDPQLHEVEEGARIAQILSDEHNEVVAYVNQVVAEEAVVKLTPAEARYKDEPIIDLIAKAPGRCRQDASCRHLSTRTCC